MKPQNLRKTVPPECGQMRSWNGKAGCAQDETQGGARRIPIQNDTGIQNGQLSIEFLVVISGLLIILATVAMPMYDRARSDADKVSKLADAREAANTIANALNTVYACGVGSKQTVEYWLPNDIFSISFVDGAENRVDIRIELNLKSDNVVQVGTILPSRSDENRVIVGNENFKVDPGLHRMSFTYNYSGNLRYIEIKVA